MRGSAWASRARCPVDVGAAARALGREVRRRADAAAAALIVPVALAGGALIGAAATSPRVARALQVLLGVGG